MEQHVYEKFDSIEDNHWWFVARRNYIRRLIQVFYSNRENLEFCEIGSGTGGSLNMLAEFALLDVVEMNDVARKLISEKKIENVRTVSDGFLPNNLALNQNYDGIFALDVIEHVEDDAAALETISKYLSNDGYFISTVPAYQWMWSKHDGDNHHFRRYTLSRYKNMVHNSGLNVVYASYFNTILFPLAVACRVGESLKSFFISNSISESKLNIPSPPINKLLSYVFDLEKSWAAKFSAPFGLSIVVVARKQT